MGDILKEAIADAKAVRETALANAKMALEEAFTPQLKSMLSAKLREEDDEFEGEEDDEESEGEGNPFAEDDEFGGDEEEDVPAEEAYEDEEFGDEEPEVEEEGIIEIDGVKYAPVVTEEDEDAEDFGGEDEEEEFEEELDLESIIKELESELSEDESSDEDTVDEAGKSDEDTVDEAGKSDEDTVDEEIEIDESLFEEGDDDEEVNEETEEDEVSEVASVHAELAEYKEAVVFLKDKLHEVNILNAKLLFTNKLFKEFSLDNNQKLKVVETFDRTQSTREIKLVYSTLAEQFSDNSSITRKHNIKESASSSVGSTKPSKESKVITEESQVANRFKKLAGLL